MIAGYDSGETTIATFAKFFADARTWAAQLQPPILGRAASTLIASAQQLIGPASQPDAEQIIEVGGVVAEIAINVGALLTLTFFWLVEHARLQRYALAFLPAGRRAGARDAWNEMEGRLGMWVRGQLILGVVRKARREVRVACLDELSPDVVARHAVVEHISGPGGLARLGVGVADQENVVSSNQ